MTPRSLVGFGSLFLASFLATWLINGPGGLRMAQAARPILEGRDSPLPATASVSWVPGIDAGTVPAADAGPLEVSDPPSDFVAAAHDAVAAANPEERVRAIQVLSSAPGEQGIDALVVVSAQGADAGERATAITSLRQRLGGTDADDRIRNAFRQAAADPDPLVAVVAQSALEESQP